MRKQNHRLFHFLSTLLMLMMSLLYIILGYIIGSGSGVFIRREMLPDEIMIGIILSGCIGLIASLALCFGGYRETWKVNMIGDVILVLAAAIQFGFGIATLVHGIRANADAESLWNGAAGHIRESWIEFFSCTIDTIDECKSSMTKYLQQSYIPFTVIFLGSALLSISGSIVSFYWVRHIIADGDPKKINSKEAFEVLVLR